MKPMLASDYKEDKLRFPLIAQPKIDGVRGMQLPGGQGFTGRSLKPHANRYTTELYSDYNLIGFDGEVAAELETHPDLCRITSSALSRIEGHPFTLWWIFDYVTTASWDWPYRVRLDALNHQLEHLKLFKPEISLHLRRIPWILVRELDELLWYDNQWLDMGFEGTIVRDPEGKYKEGRSTVREGGLLRIKRFVDFEFVVTDVIEGEENQNAAQVNELGLQFRSSHKANMVPNGMVGAMIGRVLADVQDLQGKVVLQKDEEVKVAAGRLTRDQRLYYFQHQDELKSKICKGKLFPKGIKDKPRFPTWQMFRLPSDMSVA